MALDIFHMPDAVRDRAAYALLDHVRRVECLHGWYDADLAELASLIGVPTDVPVTAECDDDVTRLERKRQKATARKRAQRARDAAKRDALAS